MAGARLARAANATSVSEPNKPSRWCVKRRAASPHSVRCGRWTSLTLATGGLARTAASLICSGVADAWVDHPVQHVGNQVADGDQEGGDHDHGRDHGPIVAEHTIAQQATHPGPGEDRLGYDCAR